jgi:hypothetical protein
MGPVQESVKSITTIFEGEAPESSKESLQSDETIFMVNGRETLLSMLKVRHRNQLAGPEVPSIQCIIGPLKDHYALYD